MSPNQFFGNTLNLLPMQNSVTAARAFYEHKFITQALPIKDGESPNVQSLKNADNNESYEDYLGKKPVLFRWMKMIILRIFWK